MPEALINQLADIVGNAGLRTGNDDTASFLTDWHGQYHGQALAVVMPETTAQVANIMAFADANDIVVVPQGGNTGFMGGATPDADGRTILLSLRRMNRIREIDATNMSMTVEAGCVLQSLHEETEKQGLYFPLNLAAKGSCTIGGNLGTNAGGLNVVRYGTTRELTLGLEVVLMGGRVLNMLSGLRKDNTGYDLRNLFVGSEGTLGVITAATMKLFPQPAARATAFAEVRDVEAAVALLHRLQAASGGGVEAFELIPADILHVLFHHFPNIPQPLATRGKMNVLMEIASTNPASGIADDTGQSPLRTIIEETLGAALEDGLVLDATIAASEAQRQALWDVRETAPESHKMSAGVARSDISLPQSALAPFYDEMVAGIRAIDPNLWICGYGHIGDGNLHFNLIADEKSNADFDSKKVDLYELLYEKVAKYNGSISAEHGIGQTKRAQLAKVKSPEIMDVMRAIKASIDPKNLMNPGKVV
ncbi:MAG TPA: FAD-binding oxidoreductase [Alphaproteobacteria bacterium]|jgi:FAD/FMN-containing dehydrogenase|nr:MAG: FAD/FMN-containing dehydrogenase [SAR116 cluster bacterium MED-G05]HAO57836.1 FAD-binding oxidoreductase [Alphaproteobacteria bacterium]HBD51990.1 FAD-binding oxidoreductase [Alphaproteobacteria bacterium]HBP73295.1 FAD-binding oxidoreductase [Alphaproteobacteria bacterium]HCA15398.1 FAD-binding oxidoreductase [Alphaproteobacteria bacterium]|tara:strand:- start:1314 stop:2747 length:1434 start_codon:yes stop_codon:yes gene_type:complete